MPATKTVNAPEKALEVVKWIKGDPPPSKAGGAVAGVPWAMVAAILATRPGVWAAIKNTSLNPARIGNALRVQGCETRVAGGVLYARYPESAS